MWGRGGARILPWVLTAALGCAGGGAPAIEEVAHPRLTDAEEAVRDQVGAARERLEALQDGGAGRAGIGAASGELGRLYHAYGFETAARGAYRNATSQAQEVFQWHYLLGVLEQQQGDLPAARDALERALAIQPTDTPALLHLGQVALESADYDSAGSLYARAVEADGRCSAGHFGLGRSALGAGDPAAAATSLEKALELAPEATQVHRYLAAAYRGLGETDRARDHLARAGGLAPTCPDPVLAELPGLLRGARAVAERATRADAEGHSDSARTLARQAIAADADLAAPRRLLGKLLIERGELDAALRELSTAARLEPNDPGTYILLGQAHRATGDLDTSLTQLLRAVELDPQSADAHLQLALTRIDMGHWSAARVALETAVDLEPAHHEARVQLGRTLAATGRQDEGVEMLERVITAAPDHALAQTALGAILLERGRPTVARERFEAAIEGDGTAATWALAHFQLARIAAENGNGQLAETHLRTARALAPSFFEAQIALGQLVSTLGRHPEAAEIFATAIASRPEDPGAYKGEALALLLAGRHLDARRRLESASSKFPQDDEITLILARLLATAPAPRVRNGSRALQIALALWQSEESLANGETVAMAYAALGRFDTAIEWQTRMVEAALAAEAEAKVIEPVEARLEDYRQGRRARFSWQPSAPDGD